MDIAYQLGQYLANANFGTLGTSIFVGQMPSDQNGLYVQRSSGTLGYYVPVEYAILDIYCKDTSAADCINLLERIKRHIHRMHNTVTGNAYIYSMLVVGDVQDVDRDLEYAKIFKITVSVMCRDTDLIS